MGFNDTSFGRGEANANSVMTNAQVSAARYLRRDYGMSQPEIAKMYGMCRSAVSAMLRGITYPDAGGPLDPGRRRGKGKA